MRAGFGQGVSIPSQVRWIDYVDRWTQNGKRYEERSVEVLEVRVWGLRDGVKVAVEGFVKEGREIQKFHVFNDEDRFIIQQNEDSADVEQDQAKNGTDTPSNSNGNNPTTRSTSKRRQTGLEPGGALTVFKPLAPTRIILPTNDINIAFERRNPITGPTGAKYYHNRLTMVTSVAHVWFNAYIEEISSLPLPSVGREEEQKSVRKGMFEIDWEEMDGIKGGSFKGSKALDKIAIVWKVVVSLEPENTTIAQATNLDDIITNEEEEEEEEKEEEEEENNKDKDEKGGDHGLNRNLGLRAASVASMSAASRLSHSRSPVRKVDEEKEDEDEGGGEP